MSELNLAIHVGGMVSTNGYLLEFGETSLVIDAPKGMYDFVEKYELTPKALLLTHQHYDHVEDVELFAKAGIPVYAHSSYSDDLVLVSLAQRWGFNLKVEPFKVDHLLKDEEMITIGEELNIGVIPVPGHSPDSLAYYLAGKQILFGGDTLFNGSIGRTDLPRGDHDQLLSAIRDELLVLDDEVVVFPGHGEETTIGYEKEMNRFLCDS